MSEISLLVHQRLALDACNERALGYLQVNRRDSSHGSTQICRVTLTGTPNSPSFSARRKIHRLLTAKASDTGTSCPSSHRSHALTNAPFASSSRKVSNAKQTLDKTELGKSLTRPNSSDSPCDRRCCLLYGAPGNVASDPQL